MPVTEEPNALTAYDPAREAIAAQLFGIVTAAQEWVDTFRERVEAGFLKFTEGIYELTVLGRTQAFDYDLNKSLADLCIKMAHSGLPVAGTLLPASASKPLFTAGRIIRLTPT